MKRKELLQLLLPLSDKLYSFAFAVIPDDLQAEQLVIDGLNAYLLKEKKHILKRDVDMNNKKEVQILRRMHFKGVLRYMSDIGARRAVQLTEQMKVNRPEEFAAFYKLDPKVRMAMSLRYDVQFTVEEIEEIVQTPRYEVIEKIHNGRFLLLNNLNQDVNL